MANVQRGLITKNDAAFWDGITKTSSRVDATGGTVTGQVFGEAVDVLRVFGDGTNYTLAAINDAITRLSGASATLDFAAGTWTITDNLTIPSNVSCRVFGGAIFSVSAGKTLTFSGPVVRQWNSWTSGSGTVVVTVGSANLIDIQDSGSKYNATTVEAAFAELASVASGEGASIIALEDAAAKYAAVNVEAALAELTSVASGEGAAIIGLNDAAGNLDATNVEAAIAEIFDRLSVTKLKAGSKSLNTNTALEDDNELLGWSLVAGKHYEVSGYVKYTQSVGNLKFDFSFTNTPSFTSLTAVATDTAGADEQSHSANITSTPITLVAMGDGLIAAVSLHGVFKANVTTGGTVDFRWAQGTSDANNTTVITGSLITLRQLD